MIKNSLGKCASLLAAFLLLATALTGCSRQTGNQEQNFSHTADADFMADNNTAAVNNTEAPIYTPDNETPVEYTGDAITKVIEGSDGRNISIEAPVYSEGIEEVSCYKYVPKLFTEEQREDLLKKMHPAESWDVLEAAAYQPEKDAWEFVTPLGESWTYQISLSEIPGEEILNHESTTANIFFAVNQVVPIAVQKDTMDTEDILLLEAVCTVSLQELEQIGLDDIGSIDKNSSYACSFIHICEAADGQAYVKVVFKKILDGMPVTAWHDFSTAVGNSSPFPAKIWGSLFSEEEIGLEGPILSAREAVDALQEQVDSIPIQEAPLSITKIRLEYLSVISPEGELLIVPVWRFYAGEDEAARILRSEEVIAINAINGDLIWETREAFVQ